MPFQTGIVSNFRLTSVIIALTLFSPLNPFNQHEPEPEPRHTIVESDLATLHMTRRRAPSASASLSLFLSLCSFWLIKHLLCLCWVSATICFRLPVVFWLFYGYTSSPSCSSLTPAYFKSETVYTSTTWHSLISTAFDVSHVCVCVSSLSLFSPHLPHHLPSSPVTQKSEGRQITAIGRGV